MNQVLVKTVAISEIQQNISWDLKYRIEQVDKAMEENRIAMECCEDNVIYEEYKFNYEKYKVEMEYLEWLCETYNKYQGGKNSGKA